MYSEKFAVRFYETDALKHVNNTVVGGWFETGRHPIFKIFTPTLDVDNWPLIIAGYRIDFIQQIHFGFDVEIRTWVKRIGNSSFDIYQELWQNEALKATGTTTLVHFSYKSQKSVPIEGDIRTQLEQHLTEQD